MPSQNQKARDLLLSNENPLAARLGQLRHSVDRLERLASGFGGNGIISRLTVHKTTPQALASGVWTTVTWDEIIYDDESAFSSDTVVVPTTGAYDIFLHLGTDASRSLSALIEVDTGAGFAEWLRTGIFSATAGDEPYGAGLSLGHVPLTAGHILRVRAHLTGAGGSVLAQSYWTVRRWN